MAIASEAQILTAEDSLNAGLQANVSTTYISGYGEVFMAYDHRWNTATANVKRNILFVGHKFNDKISFFSEMELENAAVIGGNGLNAGGDLSMEQLFLKFNLNRNNYLVAGLFIPRLGIINENHLPTTFNGNERHRVEQEIIPATWREIGIGLYSNIQQIPGLNLSIALLNGLDSRGFSGSTGIAGGKFGGNNATASNLAITGSALYYYRNWRAQASYYYGGSAGLSQRMADSLQLNYGAFGTPVQVAEANVQYLSQGFTFKVLGTMVSIDDAQKINRAYASNTPKQMMGALAEIGYNIFHRIPRWSEKNLTLFGRYEYVNLNQKLAENGIPNAAYEKQYLTAGVTFMPVQGVAVKLDYTHRLTGEQNPALWVNPFPQPIPYYTSQGTTSLGIAYSF